MSTIKVIDMDGKEPEEPQKDFRAELAALIQAKNETNHPNAKMLEEISAKLVKATDELVKIKQSYLKLHNISEDKTESLSYDINAIVLGLGYALHECHKIMANMEAELKKAKS